MATLPLFIIRLCSAALIGVAALSLAACGSGGGESTDPARLSAVEDREKRVASREAAVSQKEKDQAAKDRQQRAKDVAQARKDGEQATKDQQQAAKDREQAAKDRELNNRPPRVETRTVTVPAPRTGPTHVGFSGGNFSSDEIRSLASKVVDVQKFGSIVFYHRQETPRIVHGEILPQDKGYIFPKMIPSVTDGNVFLTLKTYDIDKTVIFEYDATGTLARENSGGRTSTDGYKIFELANPTDIAGLGLSDTFTYKLFKGEVDPRRRDTTSAADDSKFHAELATDYASDNTGDYLHFGWWVLAPKQTDRLGDYRFGVFADAAHEFNADPFNALTGTATYTGSMMGLHTDIDSEGKHTLSRLTGKASLAVDFGTNSVPGTITGTFNELKLNGTDATGSIVFTKDMQESAFFEYLESGSDTATINGISYRAPRKIENGQGRA